LPARLARRELADHAASLPMAAAAARLAASALDPRSPAAWAAPSRGAASAAAAAPPRLALVKVGDADFFDVPLDTDALLRMRVMHLLVTLFANAYVAARLEGVALNECEVFVLPRVAGKVPTAAEEADAVRLKGVSTVGSVLPAGAGGHVFIRVCLPPPAAASAAAATAAYGASALAPHSDARSQRSSRRPVASSVRFVRALVCHVPRRTRSSHTCRGSPGERGRGGDS